MTDRGRLRRVLRGPEEDPAWVRPTLLGTLALAAIAYTWALDASGYGNEYYAAAAYSGSMDWTAWLFGSFDPASFVSVDKPPVSLWVTGLSVRAFGLSSWSILLPQALAGVASVAILYRTAKRWKGHATGLLAAGAFATTPIVLVMFRYNNPDAVLSVLLISAIAVTSAAVERASGWLLAAAGALVGFAFLTKTTQALLVIPAMAVTYLVFADIPLKRRMLHGLASATAAVVAAGWWIVLAVTSSAAPFAGQTDSGSFVDYILGVNGLDRLSSAGGGPAGGADPFGGSGGWGRLFNAEVGGQISWLIPLAVTGVVIGVVVRSSRRSERAGWALWGSVFITHFVVFSLMSWVFHPYYSMTMAPSIAVLAAAGVVDAWQAWRAASPGWWLLPVGVGATGVWAAVLLGRVEGFLPWLGPTLVVATCALVTFMVASRPTVSLDLKWRVAVAAVAGMVCLAGPAVYAVSSIGTDYSGGDPAAGPGETGRPVALAGEPDAARPTDQGDDGRPSGEGRPLPPPGGVPATGDGPDVGSAAVPRGDDGGPGGAVAATPELVEFLVAEHRDEIWIVATVGTQTAASIILDTGEAVMAMGGFSGGDPTPTVAELEEYIADGALRFVLLGNGNQGRSQDWASVVEARCDPVGGFASLYDCGI